MNEQKFAEDYHLQFLNQENPDESDEWLISVWLWTFLFNKFKSIYFGNILALSNILL